MKISAITTHRHPEFGNLLHLEVETSDGVVGLGETYYFAQSVSEFVHEHVAPSILGRDPFDRESISQLLRTYVGYNGSGIETRARSAVDMALWDIAGKISGQPVYNLLGGQTRSQIRLYNTCAGSGYMRNSDQSSTAWGTAKDSSNLEDLQRFMTDAGSLATELVAEGITAMKIWPFDLFAEQSRGTDISTKDLNTALSTVEKIRGAVGNDMDVLIELHSLWTPSAARKIMNALKDFNIYWVEDPIHPDLVDGLELLREDGMPKIAVGETIASRTRVQQLVSRNLIDVLTLDISWCGGLTEAQKFAAIAESHGVLIAPHDCTGPVSLLAATHLSTAAPNTLIQETVRAALRTWYPSFVDQIPVVSGGWISAPQTPGLGANLISTSEANSEVITRTTR